jgi:lipopolysaccharide export system protein LptC
MATTPDPGPKQRWFHPPSGGRRLSRTYSRLVSLLRIALPLLALMLIGLIAAWPSLHDVSVSQARIDKNQTAMVNARYFSRDRMDRPFSMNAESAAEVPGQPNLVDLVKPEAEMTQNDGSWVTVTARRGRYAQDTGRLLLLDHVHLIRDDGLEFVTDEAELDTKTGNAWGDRKVAGQGPNGEIRAEGFIATDNGKTITFAKSSNASIAGGANKGKSR